MKHDYFPLMSDINSTLSETYYWYRCRLCGKETPHTKKRNENPPDELCEATNREKSIFPLSSVI